MIIIRLSGGLGNQMFQFTFGKYIELEFNTTVKFDITFIDAISNSTRRKYELGIFNLKIGIASRKEILKHCFPSTKLSLIDNLLFVFYKNSVYVEKKNIFNEFDIKKNTDAYFIGLWQCYNYFNKFKDIIVRIFQFSKTYYDNNTEILSLIKDNNSVSIHFRRGDYLTNSKARMFHFFLDYDYYNRAIDYFNKIDNTFIFFLFSDQPELIDLQKINTNKITVVRSNEQLLRHNDLFLMSKCKHNIIANSTYSLWAAYLNENPGKVVIAPNNWYNNKNINNEDLIPNEWIRF